MNERKKPANQWLMDMSIKQRLEMYRLFFTGYLSVENGDNHEVIDDYKAKFKAMRRLWNLPTKEVDEFEQEIRTQYAKTSKFLDGILAEFTAKQSGHSAHLN